MADPDTPGPGSGDEAGRGRRSSGWGGCALWAVAFFVVTIGGCAIGLSLRSDPNAAQNPVTVEAGSGWTLEVHQDASKAPCTDLYGQPAQSGDPAPQLAGQCAYATEDDGSGALQYKATSYGIDGQVVVFGPVPKGVATVRLTLADGTHPEVGTGSRQGVHYFVHAGDAADVGPTVLLDAKGNRVSPPPAPAAG